MASGTYQYQNSVTRRYVAQGETRALRTAVMRVLTARGLALSDGRRARVASCEDVSTLMAWLERAATAASEAEVFKSSMARRTYQYQSDFARRHVAQGEARGFRAAVMRVLAARGLALSDEGHERVASCEDVSTLMAWLERAARAASEAEVFAGSDITHDP